MKEVFGRQLYSLKESYEITYFTYRSLPKFIHAKKNALLSQQFIERIMLAVTEVNGCEICSYAHTKMALESGMTSEEIQNMLAGVSDDVPLEEMPAVMFAQHYADSRAHPTSESWERILEIYGPMKAKGILGAVRIIMWGNTYGIAWTALRDRFKKKANDRSNLLYEITMVISTFIYLPLALIHALLASLFRVKDSRVKEDHGKAK